ncbi:MAG: hypothetical protein PHD33_06160 [Atribacterota bacterium]|jgi:uncharacterized coiled-coil DUF342 family protein|nr:hypothetical protein [Atribacterota bacterium]
MGKETENFLKAEEYANKLVDLLQELRNESNSYKGATNEINRAREKLTELIDSMKGVSKDFRAAIEIHKKIGTPEINNNILLLKDELKDSTDNLKESIAERFNKLESKVDEINKKQLSYMKRLQIFIIITLIISLFIIVFLIEPNYIIEFKTFFNNLIN